MFEHPSIAEISEAELVRRLLPDPYRRESFIGHAGIPENVKDLQCVDLSGLGIAGDVDILLCAPDEMERAIAIEVKRVKVGNGRPNKLKGISKGIQQANRLATIGFSKVYFYVLVEVDSREQTLTQDSWTGIPPEAREEISRAVNMGGLDSRIGLFRYDFIQTEDDYPLGSGSSKAQQIRPAGIAQQPQRVTDWVANQFTGAAGAVAVASAARSR